ncbi:DUF6879 family protein [Streptacidiphilus sp. N1-12]|uniref:DUF6879 family protein n=2 Tax=Streptacidiphilus alkalitolerans TaxID=3342712 RepID=A0ABV6WQL7_9ACTN
MDPASDHWRRSWVELIGETTGRGVVVQRARIVSEPVSEYIRYEHAGSGSLPLRTLTTWSERPGPRDHACFAALRCPRGT